MATRYISPTKLWRLSRPGSCSPREFPDAGTVGSVVKTGTGSGSMDPVGQGDAQSFPIDAYQVRAQVVTAGELGTARVKVSLNGGVDFGPALLIPKSGVVVVPLTGITLTFAGGAAPSFSVGDRWDFTTTASPEMLSAIDAAGAELDGYLEGSYALPLLAWGSDLEARVADVARYRLMTGRGIADAERFRRAYDDALRWAEKVGRGLIKLSGARESGPSYEFPDVVTTRQPYGMDWRA